MFHRVGSFVCALALGILLVIGNPGPVTAQTHAAGAVTPNTKILGGVVAARGAWPWQVQLYFRRPNGAFTAGCGGAIIDERWVLTAAHCFKARTADDVKVLEGTHLRGSSLDRGTGHVMAVRRIVSHPQYNGETQENDIALLELASSARSRPIMLASASRVALEAAGRNIIATGWGLLRPIRIVNGRPLDFYTREPVRLGDPRYFSNRLMQVEMPIVDQNTCHKAYANLIARGKMIDHRSLCAGVPEGGKDTCQGDSGGPLVTQDEKGGYVQVGIVSWGRSCGLPNSYGINTRVSAFSEWIELHTGIKPPQPLPVPPAFSEPTPPSPTSSLVAGTPPVLRPPMQQTASEPLPPAPPAPPAPPTVASTAPASQSPIAALPTASASSQPATAIPTTSPTSPPSKPSVSEASLSPLLLPLNVAAGDRALLIGVDRYQNERFNLRGTGNDVRNMRSMLIDVYGFKPEQIVTLTDAQATRHNILTAFDKWLIDGSSPKSRVVFFMSSHGFQEADRAGEEYDGLDETLMPYDVALEHVGKQAIIRNQIIDDELRDRFSRMPDRRIMAIIDACFSGTSTRGGADIGTFKPGTVKYFGSVLTGEELKGIENARAVLTASLNRRALMHMATAPDVPPPSGFIARSDNVVAWSATSEAQLALVDVEGAEPQGVFTHHFIDGIRNRRADRSGDGIVSFAELLNYVRRQSEAYCSRNRKQCQSALSPQLEARRELLAADVVTEHIPDKPPAVAVSALAHDNSAGVVVSINPGDRVKIGQTAQFQVSTRKPGYLVLVDLTPDGRMTQIFPNKRSLTTPLGKRQRANLVEPGRPLLVPDRRNPYEGFEFTVEPPVGEGLLVAILSEQPIRSVPLPEMPMSVVGMAGIVDYITTLSAELNRNLVVEGKPPQLRGWSVAVKRYRVTR